MQFQGAYCLVHQPVLGWSLSCSGMVIFLFWDGHLLLGWSASSLGMVFVLLWDGHLLGWSASSFGMVFVLLCVGHCLLLGWSASSSGTVVLLSIQLSLRSGGKSNKKNEQQPLALQNPSEKRSLKAHPNTCPQRVKDMIPRSLEMSVI